MKRVKRGMGHFPWRSAATKSDVPSSSSAMCVPYPGEDPAVTGWALLMALSTEAALNPLSTKAR